MGSADEIVLNGGKQADSNVEAREFVIVSLGAPLFAESTRIAAEVFHAPGQHARKARTVDQRRRRGRITVPIVDWINQPVMASPHAFGSD